MTIFMLTSCHKEADENPPPKNASIEEVKPDEKWRKFFVEWLTAHGEKQVVDDDKGVGIAGNAVRLKASLHGLHQTGTGASAEVEFKIVLPTGETIIEYVAGVGKTEEAAENQAMMNFVMSTFHVVYQSFMNPDDAHQTVEKLSISGGTREVIFGDMMTMGADTTGAMESALQGIKDRIASLRLSNGAHWIKVVYGQAKGKPMIVAATLDNADHAELTEEIGKLDWPKREEFYMAKQFMLIK